MGVTVGDFAAGRKVFFITPDRIIFPESNLLDYFALGYECYFVENDKQNTLKDRIIRIITTFNGCILFFNVDMTVPGINWINYITELNTVYGDKVTIGVFFVRRQDKRFKPSMEIVFNQKIGITGGCVQLEYQKKTNFTIVQNVLIALQAKGRRQSVRSLCTKKYTYSFSKDGQNYTGQITDLSLSHFSFASQDYTFKMNMGERIQDFNLYLDGLIIRTSVSLLMNRDLPDSILYVFAFCDAQGKVGLNERYKDNLTENLYKLNCDNLKIVMDKVKLQFDNDVTDAATIGRLVIDNK